jgi:hypothetical protein
LRFISILIALCGVFSCFIHRDGGNGKREIGKGKLGNWKIGKRENGN